MSDVLAQIRIKFIGPRKAEIEVNGQRIEKHVKSYFVTHNREDVVPHVHLELLSDVEIEGPGIVEVTRD